MIVSVMALRRSMAILPGCVQNLYQRKEVSARVPRRHAGCVNRRTTQPEHNASAYPPIADIRADILWSAPLGVDRCESVQLAICRACSSSKLTGLLYPSAEWRRLVLYTSSMKRGKEPATSSKVSDSIR